MKWLAEKYMTLTGWRFVGGPPAGEPKYLIVGAPHTSNWDFVVFLGAMRHFAIRPRFLGKHTLFRGPFGWLFRRWGGIPVDRANPGGIVDDVRREFESNEEIALVIAPEGTRKAAPYWKSGFLKIAEATGAPIVPAGVDFATKTLILGEPVRYDGSPDRLMDGLRRFFAGTSGRNPEGKGPVRIREESTATG